MNQISLFGGHYPLVRDMGFTHVRKGWYHPNRILDYHVLIYGYEGYVQVVEDGEEYVIKPGDVFFLKRGLHHYGARPTSSSVKQFWVHFYDGRLPGAGNAKGSVYDVKSGMYKEEDYELAIPLPKQAIMLNRSYIESKIKELFGIYTSEVSYRQLSISLCTNELLLTICRECQKAEEGGKAYATVRRIADYLESHPDRALDTQELARYMGLNYNYMSTIFRKQTGYSIREYHERVRVFKATEFMRGTTLNVSEISLSVGYEDPLYFSKVFKKIIGKSPSAYISQIYRNI